IDDYAVGQVTITEADVNDIKAYGATKPTPSSPVISYISANSAEAFKNKRMVEGSFNQGITDNGQTKTISHTNWKNVVVFETYRGSELIDVAMVGTGSSNNSSTHVRYPDGATRIEAVSWNGDRTLVFGQR
ncbi:MAG: M60 family metallopeptidase, partial [Bacteroidales bacterium]